MSAEPRGQARWRTWGILAILLFSSTACEALIGPRWAINRTLDEVAAEGLTLEPENTELALRFVSRTVEVEGDRATVFARGEVSGTLGGIETECICVEAIPLRRKRGDWKVVGFPLSRLAAVVEALDARRDAFEARDEEAYRALIHPDYEQTISGGRGIESRLSALLADHEQEDLRQEILRRTMRVERHEAIATEEWRLVRGVDGSLEELARGKARYVLLPTPDGWRFASGLM